MMAEWEHLCLSDERQNSGVLCLEGCGSPIHQDSADSIQPARERGSMAIPGSEAFHLIAGGHEDLALVVHDVVELRF